MSLNLYWLHCGGCSGDTMSLLNAEAPDLLEALEALDLEVLWHPSLSDRSPASHAELRHELTTGARPLDVLVIEGAVIRGPTGTGFYDTIHGRPKKDLVAALAARARFVIAAGTCASFGGVSGAAEIEATGLQFFQEERGGFFGVDFRSTEGWPVINLPGCPCHPSVVVGTLTALVRGESLPLDPLQCPHEWYDVLIHQGCTRNEYHEYRVEETDFGQKGCLFFHMGCRGPLAYGVCNKILWNRRHSKTRAGVPCFGCTHPTFPQKTPFFATPNIEGLPLVLPDGVDRAHYMAYKGMAAAAAPQRLKDRETGV